MASHNDFAKLLFPCPKLCWIIFCWTVVARFLVGWDGIHLLLHTFYHRISFRTYVAGDDFIQSYLYDPPERRNIIVSRCRNGSSLPRKYLSRSWCSIQPSWWFTFRKKSISDQSWTTGNRIQREHYQSVSCLANDFPWKWMQKVHRCECLRSTSRTVRIHSLAIRLLNRLHVFQ